MLHVQFDAPSVVIKASYRTIMQKLQMHPDLGGDEEYAKLLNHALSVLLDADKRAVYDASLHPIHGDTVASGLAQNNSAKGAAASNEEAPDSSVGKTRSGVCLFCNSPYSAGLDLYTPWQQAEECNTCSAPLNMVPDCELVEGGELRRLLRMDYISAIQIKVSHTEQSFMQAQLSDFSVQGVRLLSPVKLRLNQYVLLKSDYLNAVAEVRSCQLLDDSSWATGLQFCTLRLNLPSGELFSASI